MKLKSILPLSLGAMVILSSCSGSSSSSKPAAIEVFGTWVIFESGKETCKAGGESITDPVSDEYSATLTQDGSKVTLKTGGDAFTGKMSGETLTWNFSDSETISDGTYKETYSGKVTYNETTGKFKGTATYKESGPGSLNDYNGEPWTCESELDVTATCDPAGDCGVKDVK